MVTMIIFHSGRQSPPPPTRLLMPRCVAFSFWVLPFFRGIRVALVELGDIRRFGHNRFARRANKHIRLRRNRHHVFLVLLFRRYHHVVEIAELVGQTVDRCRARLKVNERKRLDLGTDLLERLGDDTSLLLGYVVGQLGHNSS